MHDRRGRKVAVYMGKATKTCLSQRATRVFLYVSDDVVMSFLRGSRGTL